MEAKQLPQKLKIVELENALKVKDEAYQLLEKNFQSLQEDHRVINTMLSLSQAQLETSI